MVMYMKYLLQTCTSTLRSLPNKPRASLYLNYPPRALRYIAPGLTPYLLLAKYFWKQMDGPTVQYIVAGILQYVSGLHILI